jgi:hypothetical protein
LLQLFGRFSATASRALVTIGCGITFLVGECSGAVPSWKIAAAGAAGVAATANARGARAGDGGCTDIRNILIAALGMLGIDFLDFVA